MLGWRRTFPRGRGAVKRLVCFFDGTWNKPEDADQTNVVKLQRAVLAADAGGVRQVVHYEVGIATESSSWRADLRGRRHRLRRRRPHPRRLSLPVRELRGGRRDLPRRLLARSIRGAQPRRVDRARRHRPLRRPGDDLRGVGLLRAEQAGARSCAVGGAACRRIAIRCASNAWPCGTRSAISEFRSSGRGLIKELLGFHDTELSPTVDVGLHALSIDEPRGPFSPTLWTIKKGTSLPPGQIVEQVWFPGCHANVGGGYKDCALSDVALLWMAERLTQTTGLAVDLEHLRATTKPDPLGEQVSPTSDGIYRVSYLLPFIRLIKQNRKGISALRRAFLGSWRSSLLPRRARCPSTRASTRARWRASASACRSVAARR